MFLWIAQAVSMTAQQAIWFGMIVVVEERTRSSTQLSIAILTTIIPAVLVGLAAGVFVDHTNKKTVLVATNFLRAVTVLGYLLYGWSLYVVYAVNVLFVTISQFFGPAEASSIPALVPRRHLIVANSLFNITFTASQLVGIVLLAPAIIKAFGPPWVFVTCSALYLIAGALVSFLPPGIQPEKPLSSLHRETVINLALGEVSEVWAFIRSDRQTSWAMIHITITSTLMLVMAMLAPRYMVDVLDIRPEDAVFLFAPAGIGILAITTTLSRLTSRFKPSTLVNIGFTGGGVAVALMSMLVLVEGPMLSAVNATIGQVLQLPLRHALIPPLMLISLAIGIGYALASVPSQAILMERAPVVSRGRIFSLLLMTTNVGAIIPLVFLGSLSDAVGVDLTLGVTGALVLAVGVVSFRTNREGAAAGTAESAG
jgi:MFS family permease